MVTDLSKSLNMVISSPKLVSDGYY